MTNPIPRVLAIHDLSGFGRCSLTVILPVLSALGVQVCPLPTAVLSTHTGGFAEVAMRDLTDFLAESLSRYQELKLDFDCVYSGFLGSEDQIDICADCLSRYPDALKVVDPVMGDHGKPYRTYTPAMQRRMGELARHADLITPNLTEACMLLGQPYRVRPSWRPGGENPSAAAGGSGPLHSGAHRDSDGEQPRHQPGLRPEQRFLLAGGL